MKRFCRIDKSRYVKGSGLGLSIVRAIDKLHDFDISVDDAQPGCCFELLFYARSRPDEEPARVTALRRSILPVTRLARNRSGETDSVDGIGRRVTIDAASDAADQRAA